MQFKLGMTRNSVTEHKCILLIRPSWYITFWNLEHLWKFQKLLLLHWRGEGRKEDRKLGRDCKYDKPTILCWVVCQRNEYKKTRLKTELREERSYRRERQVRFGWRGKRVLKLCKYFKTYSQSWWRNSTRRKKNE